MEPSEKAQELFSEYRFSLSLPNSPLGDSKDGIAIACAIIACEQLKESECEECGHYHNMSYWEKVIQELKKLNL